VFTTLATATVGAVLGAWLRAAVFYFSVRPDEPWRTACPNCATAVLGGGGRGRALLVGSRCTHCGTRIGPPPGTVEAVTAAVFGALAWQLGASVVLIAVGWAALVSVALAFVDGAVHRLPNRLVLAGIVGTALGLGAAALRIGGSTHLVTALIGAGAASLAYFLLVFAFPRGLGLGDAKLAVLVGLVTGWFGLRVTVFALVAGMMLAGFGALGLLLAGRAGRGDHLAYGPYMLAGALVAVLAH
jgi:leader peptidase (prepilin peptidase)/N-methyltransferase